MGVPLVLEAGSRRWGPVLLAFFLAASRGKVGGAWVLGGAPGEHGGQGGGGVTGQMGVPWEPPSACPDPHPAAGKLLELLGRGQQLSATKCPGGVVGHICMLTAAQAAA